MTDDSSNKFCIDCKYYKPPMGNAYIGSAASCHNLAVMNQSSPESYRVFGKATFAAGASTARADSGPCGKDGKYWEAKEPIAMSDPAFKAAQDAMSASIRSMVEGK